MTAKPKLSLTNFLPNHINLFDNKEKNWPLALGLSFIIHLMIIVPSSTLRNRPIIDPGNLMEVKLVAPQKTLTKPSKSSQPPTKPVFKRRVKTKIKKKPATLKKKTVITKESTLAKRKSIPRKKPIQASNKLDEIKKRLARQQDEQKLNNIRERLRRESSPAAQARQASLTQTYQMQLKAWLMRNWHLPEHLLNSGLEATISLTIAANGRLLAQTEEKLSDNLIFNHAMHQAVINATPFPSFPEELNIHQEEFVITFNPNNLKH
ncbi:MAG: hypothetical protein DRH03_04565 [Deltaproteobacteria bacterium]|nr:MAG: hypothetical protein DRH03_04565 [Deltaproteobacteria bacterium]